MHAEHKTANLRNGRALSSLSFSKMITVLTALLAASSLRPSLALLAVGRGSYHAAWYGRSYYGTVATDSSRGANSHRVSQNFPLLRSRTTTNLFFRQGDQEDSDERKKDHRDAAQLYSRRFSRWWNSIRRGNAEPDDATKLVDDYLEFLDRRYHRLHDKQSSKGVKFSALNWLMEKPTITEDEKADALFVLGLAELASDRLLEKHHIAVPRDHKAVPQQVGSKSASSQVVVEAELVETSADVTGSSPFVSLPGEVLRKIGAGRQQLITIQARQLRAAVVLLMKTLISLPGKTLRALWHLGGGKKTLTLTGCALITAVVVVRPVVQALVKQKTIHG